MSTMLTKWSPAVVSRNGKSLDALLTASTGCISGTAQICTHLDMAEPGRRNPPALTTEGTFGCVTEPDAQRAARRPHGRGRTGGQKPKLGPRHVKTRARKAERSGWLTKGTYLFRGCIRCAVCGRKMAASPRAHAMYCRQGRIGDALRPRLLRDSGVASPQHPTVESCRDAELSLFAIAIYRMRHFYVWITRARIAG